MKNALIILAGGSGKRMKTTIPKQFLKIGNTNLIEYFLSSLDYKIFDIIIISTKYEYKKKYLQNIKKEFSNHNIKFAKSGITRYLSSKNSLELLKNNNPKNVLIHDSARPLATNTLLKKIIKNLEINNTCIPFVKSNDFIKLKKNIKIKRDEIMNIQTPQGFNFKKIYNAYRLSTNINFRDDSSVIERFNEKLKMINGEITNFKITTKEDLLFFNRMKIKNYRSGIGYDVHKIDFSSKKKLVLCGIKIKHPPLIGHSDADVGYHAICDSILGSLSMKDIGFYFNNKNSKWKNANSKIFVQFCKKELDKKGYKINNIDINFICETPNIKKIELLMKKNITKLLNISISKISIKATTNEKIGFIGKGEGIAAESIIQICHV